MAGTDPTLRQLRRILESDRQPLHSRLPAERVLARELGVSRSTLRKALGVLEAEGKLRRHVGQGTFVGSPPPKGKGALKLSHRPNSPREILQARLILEPQIVGLAALAATEADIEHMRYFVEKSELAPDFESYEVWDTSLHNAFAEASHNAVLAMFMNLVSELRKHAEWSAASRAALTSRNQSAYSAHHRDIVAAIAERNSSKAAEKMRSHLSAVEQDMTGSL